MKHIFTTFALGVALAATFAAPASAADKETRQLMADIRILQEQSQELQNAIGSLTSSMTEALKAVSSRLEQQAETTRKSFADQKTTIDSVSGDLRAVKERIDDNGVRLGQVTQEVDALRQSVLRINVSPAVAGPSDERAVNSGGAAAAPGVGIGGGLSPTAAFAQAQGDWFAGQYDLAITEFEQYLKDFPGSEQADDAQVLIGNSYLQLNKNDKAVDAYDLAIRTYPKGDKLPEAYYKKGLAHANLKQIEQARLAFDFVIKNYRDSGEAILAKQGLDKLPQPSAPPPAKR